MLHLNLRCQACYIPTRNQPDLKADLALGLSDDVSKLIKSQLEASERRASDLGYSSDLTYNHLGKLWLAQGGRCAISGATLTPSRARETLYFKGSLDRIDSAAGYTIGNVQWLCWLVNVMKQKLTKDELVGWCHKIVNYDEDEKGKVA